MTEDYWHKFSFNLSAVLLLPNAQPQLQGVKTGCGKKHATHLSYHAKLTKTKTSEPTNDEQPTQFKRFLTTPLTNLLTVKPYVYARQHAPSTIMIFLQQHHFYEEMAQLQSGSTINKKTSLYRLISRHSRYITSWSWTAANTSSLKKHTLQFLKSSYQPPTDTSIPQDENRHWTSYISKATGLLEATPLRHPWSVNARFASSCLQKPLDNKRPPLREKRTQP